MLCINGVSECNGCGACTEIYPKIVDEYNSPICEGDKYYEINGIIYSEETMKQFEHIA